jgi:hypothetical protein
MSERARYGWGSDFAEFRGTPPRLIRERLSSFVKDVSAEQVRAWDDAIPPLQTEVSEVLVRDSLAAEYSAILEYELPLESRRPDVVLLVGAGVLVVELKGKLVPSIADIDQAAAYARDLRNYHRECANREVTAVLVPTRARGYVDYVSGVHVVGPDAIDCLVSETVARRAEPVVQRDAFLADTAYRPLPTIVEAARELLQTGTLRTIHRAKAATQPALDAISQIVHDAARTKTRRLILLTGIPGAGKTLVGLQTVHAKFLDDLAVERDGGKPTAPAVYLSGNGPLVEVLQYELRRAGGDGKTFVRGVKDYVKQYSSGRNPVPPEHVLVFDEAQRAYDAEQVRDKHQRADAKSEPEEFIGFADRIPEWCVVVGLIGGGQEIHVGEEGGLGQWRKAIEASSRSTQWSIHGPPNVSGLFRDGHVPFHVSSALNLDQELRFHQARDLHRWVGKLLDADNPAELRVLAEQLDRDGYHLRITRSLDEAKAYLRDRYRDDPSARYGLIASSKDRDLEAFGVPNSFQATKRLRVGPWYGDDESDDRGHSCRRLTSCVTEFGAQGLELDAALLAWGTDLRMVGCSWSNTRARGYRKGARVKDPFQLRLNSYRVLLTRGRDATVVYIPTLPDLDGTWSYLTACGFKTLGCH